MKVVVNSPSDQCGVADVNCRGTLIQSIPFEEIWVGKDTDGSEEGNSILLRMGKNYTFIGGGVTSFITQALIVKYESPIGNNDVPYPYAIDYLMIEGIMIQSEFST
jgi:hypothetical protein